MPALYNLAVSRSLPGGFAVVGRRAAREDARQFRARDEGGRREVLAAQADRRGGLERLRARHQLRRRLVRGRGRPTTKLREHLEQLDKRARHARQNRLFYLAVPPSEFGTIVNGPEGRGARQPTRPRASGPWTRVVFEKPFGHDLESARELNDTIARVFHESQVFRIDHYLGKETVQNLLVFRFANSLFEPIWNREHVDHVQITVGGGDRRRGARQVLRADRRHEGHRREPPDAAPLPHGDGAADLARRRRRARREGEGAALAPADGAIDGRART